MCVCLCARERERERERTGTEEILSSVNSLRFQTHKLAKVYDDDDGGADYDHRRHTSTHIHIRR